METEQRPAFFRDSVASSKELFSAKSDVKCSNLSYSKGFMAPSDRFPGKNEEKSANLSISGDFPASVMQFPSITIMAANDHNQRLSGDSEKFFPVKSGIKSGDQSVPRGPLASEKFLPIDSEQRFSGANVGSKDLLLRKSGLESDDQSTSANYQRPSELLPEESAIKTGGNAFSGGCIKYEKFQHLDGEFQGHKELRSLKSAVRNHKEAVFDLSPVSSELSFFKSTPKSNIETDPSKNSNLKDQQKIFHSQVLKIREEDMHLGKDLGEGLSTKDKLAFLHLDVFFYSRPILPSRLGNKTAIH